LLKFTVCHVFSGCKVKIRENTIRGGVVLTNAGSPSVVNSPGYTFPSLECLVGGNAGPNEKADWIAWGKPGCWCYARQCRGDINGKKSIFWVQAADLAIFRSAFQKNDATLNTIPNGICADLNHFKSIFRVQAADLAIFRAYFQKSDAQTPLCNQAPIITGPYNFWITPP
jgi:hypothetical protein